MHYEKKEILIAVKAYPNPSKKYEETVCVAGIDIKNGKWIRLYPINFRDLEDDKKFPKYAIIEVETAKAKNDHRPESFKLNADSIIIKDRLETKKDKDWKQRKSIVIPTLSNSFCEILEESKRSDKSLGIFQPTDVDFTFEKAKKKDIEERKQCYAQYGFFSKDKKPIEPLPYNFRYEFKCKNYRQCQGHRLLIVDWELAESYRKWKSRYPDEDTLLLKMREKWLDTLCSEKRETYFIVGNVHKYREVFMILGVFYPPSTAQEQLF